MDEPFYLTKKVLQKRSYNGRPGPVRCQYPLKALLKLIISTQNNGPSLLSRQVLPYSSNITQYNSSLVDGLHDLITPVLEEMLRSLN